MRDVFDLHSSASDNKNTERTGDRNFLALSSAARLVDGVYHYDVDLLQVCKTCYEPQVFMEATSSTKFKNTAVIRRLGSKFGAPSILIRHEFGDENLSYPLDIHYWEPGRTGFKDDPDRSWYDVTWVTVIGVLEGLRDRHECVKLK